MMDPQTALLNCFELDQEHRRELERYYLLHWRLDYLMRKLNEDGTLTHADVIYTPIWKNEFVKLDPSQQMRLSFRGSDSVGYYVLIKAM